LNKSPLPRKALAVKRGAKVKIPSPKTKREAHQKFSGAAVLSLQNDFQAMSLQKRVASFQYAFQGLRDLFQNQPNARIHLGATALVVVAGFYFQLSRTEWVAVALCITLVLSMEAVNTAIEHLTNLVSPDFHPLAGKAKDVAAAAVLLSAMGSVLVAAIIFLPKLITCF
jgi:diacylglycerol kinase (ATP)